MLKFAHSSVTVIEVPDEISLAFSISGCQIQCPGCHSQYLWVDEGKDLTLSAINEELIKQQGVTCILLMGGEHNLPYLTQLFSLLSKYAFEYKLAWYTGLDSFTDVPMDEILMSLDYVKFGPYIQEVGGLESKYTNQQMLKYNKKFDAWEDITDKFQRLSNE